MLDVVGDAVGTGDLDLDRDAFFGQEFQDIVTNGVESGSRVNTADMEDDAMGFDVHPEEGNGSFTDEDDSRLPVGKRGEFLGFKETAYDSCEKAQKQKLKLVDSPNLRDLAFWCGGWLFSSFFLHFFLLFWLLLFHLLFPLSLFLPFSLIFPFSLFFSPLSFSRRGPPRR